MYCGSSYLTFTAVVVAAVEKPLMSFSLWIMWTAEVALIDARELIAITTLISA